MAVMQPSAPQPSAVARRFKYAFNVGALLLAVLFILVAINWIAADTRVRFDLTGGRAYTLSPQTLAILDGLDEPCTLTILFSVNNPQLRDYEREPLRQARAQIDDVLQEFERRSDNIHVRSIDPTDPSRANYKAYQELIANLGDSRKDLTDQYVIVLDRAKGDVESIKSFAQQELNNLADLLAMLNREENAWAQFRQVYQILSTQASTLDQLVAQADASLETSGGQRILPDWERARSIMVASLQEPANTYYAVAQLCANAQEVTELPEAFRNQMTRTALGYTNMADKLTTTREILVELESIDLTRIIREMSTGNCVLLSESTDINIIPFEALFPRPSLEQAQQQQVYNRRFAGEAIVASALRQLTIKNPSTVVICHASQSDLLRPQAANEPSIVLAHQVLKDLGFDVQLWNTAQPDATKPVAKAADEGTTVWIIMPPSPFDKANAQNSARLADIARDLVDDGEAVLMNFWPSQMVGFGQEDYWNAVTKPFGITADSGRVILEQFPVDQGRTQNLDFVAIDDWPSDHLICTALKNLDTGFGMAIPLLLPNESSDSQTDQTDHPNLSSDGDSSTPPAIENEFEHVTHAVIADVQPTDMIWADRMWTGGINNLNPPATPDSAPYHAVIAAERALQSGTQRLIAAGSVSWFDDRITQQAVETEVGILFQQPGNLELFKSSVCWLAELNELIVPSPQSNSVPRITGLSAGTTTAWRILLTVVIPLGMLGMGIGVWYLRRD